MASGNHACLCEVQQACLRRPTQPSRYNWLSTTDQNASTELQTVVPYEVRDLRHRRGGPRSFAGFSYQGRAHATGRKL